MTSSQDRAERLWLELTSADQRPSSAKPSRVHLTSTPRETKADETTRVARVLTDEMTALRQATSARLREVRLNKGAEDLSRGAVALPKKGRGNTR